MAPLQRALLNLVVQIFDDGIVDPAQRRALEAIHEGAGLTARELESVFESLLRRRFGDVIDEETLTAEDWARLAMVARELRLSTHRVPFPVDILMLAS